MKEIQVVNKSIGEYLDALQFFSQNIHAYQRANTLHNLSSGRMFQPEEPPGENLVMTTYFTSKTDPQRNVKVPSGNFDYISKWYKTLNDLDLNGVVFTDFHDKDFFQAYSNSRVRFIPCTLGNYSLNDERYFLYYSYILHYYPSLKQVFLTDVNDITFLKSPFRLVSSSHPASLFVGRNNTKRIMYSPINQQRIDYLVRNFGVKFPANFYLHPVYNAGIIGGNKDVVLYFLMQMFDLLRKFECSANLNMILLNIVIFQHFCPHVSTNIIDRRIKARLSFRAVEFVEKMKMLFTGKTWSDMQAVNHLNDQVGNTKIIHTSYPLHNAYKSHRTIGGEYLLHK